MRRASSGTGGPCSSGHHDRGRQVVAEEQLVLIVAQVVLAVPPGGLGVGAVAWCRAAGAGRRTPGRVQSTASERLASVSSAGMAGFEQVIAGALQFP